MFTFTGLVPPSGYHYMSEEGDEALITVNTATGSMFGSMKSQGRSFVLEHCTNDHFWIEYDTKTFEEEQGDDIHEAGPPPDGMGSDALEDDGAVAEFSVMIYYTAQFAAITPDIAGFVDQVLAETNQGYTNSKVAMKVNLHCIEKATVVDSAMVMASFLGMKKTVESLRHSADTAILLVADWGPICGVAVGIDTISTGRTLAVVAKACALGYYTFGHELAHTFGAYHNRETGHINPYYPHGQGHLIDKGNTSAGGRSVMAYYYPGA